jgi:hypothetical protein
LVNLGVDGTILLKLRLRKYDGRVWIGFIWLRARTNDKLL